MAYQNPQSLPITPGFDATFMSAFDATYYDTTLVQAYANNIINKYGDQGMSDFMFITSLGGRRAIQNDTYYGWERGFLNQSITANAAVTGTTGGQIEFALVAGDVTSLGNTFVRENDVILNLRNGQRLIVNGVTVASSIATLKAAPLDGTVAAAVAVNDVFCIIGNAFDEGTGQPESIQNTWYKYSTRTQIVKDTYSISGSMDTNQPQWFQGPDGSFFAEGAMAAEYRMALKMAYTMIYGQKNTNAGVTQRTTTGLDNEIRNRGLILDYGAAATDFTVEDLIAVKDAQLRRWSGNLFLCWLPLTMQNSLNESLLSANYLNNSNIQNATERIMSKTFVGNNKEAVDNLRTTLGWDAVNVGGAMFVLKNLSILNDPKGAGASLTGFTQNTGYVIPLGKTENKETGDLASHVELVYKAQGGKNRLFEVTQDGRASVRKIGPNDVNTLYYSAEYGWMFRGMEQFTMLNTTGV
jgi:hypothetical protein